MASLEAELARCEQLLRGRTMDIEQANYREEAAAARVQELTSQVERLQKQLTEQRQEAGKMSAEAGKLRAEGSQSAQRGAREVARLKWELETERASVKELTENNQQFIAKVTALQERCSALEDARREVVGLRSRLAEMAKSRAEAMTIAASATAEAELLRVQMKEAEEKYRRTVRHAQGQEAEVQAEREGLRKKTEELDKQQARLQDDLAAVKAAGVLSKSGTMRFEIGGALLGSMPASSSRPSTAEGPDEQYRLSKQVRELQDRLRLQQGQLQERQAAVEEARRRGREEAREAMEELRAENEALRGAAGGSEGLRTRVRVETSPSRSGNTADAGGSDGTAEAEERRGGASEPASEVHWLRAELSAARQGARREQQALLEELEAERKGRAGAHAQAETRGREVVSLQVQLRDLRDEVEQQRRTPEAWRMEEMQEQVASLSAALEDEGQRAEEALTHVGEQNRLITALQGKLHSLESTGGGREQQAWGRRAVAASPSAAQGGYSAAEAPRPHTAPWASTTAGERGPSRGHTVDTVRLLRRTSNGSIDPTGGIPPYFTGEARSPPLSPATRGKRLASAWSTLSTGGIGPNGQRVALSGALRGSGPWRPQSSAGGNGKQHSMTLF